MPFALTAVGLILIITGFQNTYKQFGATVAGDFSGPNNFLYWMVAVMIVGALGYIKGLETFSRTFMTLIVISLVIAMYKKNPNVFSDIQSGISTGSSTPIDPIGAPLAGSSGGGSGGSGGGFSLSNITSDASLASDAASFLAF